MIHVSFEEFLRTGAFGPIRLGMSRAQVAAILGSPDNWGTKSGLTQARIWVYGAIDFLYDSTVDALSAMRYVAKRQLLDGTVITVDPWIIQPGVSRERVLTTLQAAGIAYEQVSVPYREGVTVITQSGVRLGFDEDPPSYGPKPGFYMLSYGSSAHSSNRDAIPLEYQLIGYIEHFWERAGVVGIRLLPGARLHAGQAIAFYHRVEDPPLSLETPPLPVATNYIRQIVEELRHQDAFTDSPTQGELVTVKTVLTKQQARNGAPVYLVASG